MKTNFIILSVCFVLMTASLPAIADTVYATEDTEYWWGQDIGGYAKISSQSHQTYVVKPDGSLQTWS